MLVSLLLRSQGDNEPKGVWEGDLAPGALDALMAKLVALQEENQRLASALQAKDAALASALARCEAAERDARTDALTGLPNRRWFMELAGRELAIARRYGRPFSLVMLDVDHFKRINDEHGHGAGDAVLEALGGLLASRLRQPDVAARYGGEEFLILCPNTEADRARALAERLRVEVARLPHVRHGQGQAIPVTASFGVATWRPDDTDLDAIVERADAALYDAKRGGRNRVCCELDNVGPGRA